MGRKYIIFRADWTEEEGVENRLLAHTGAITDILAEHFDSSNRPLPQAGYRLKEFHRIEQFVDREFPKASTHSREGDWEVTRIEQYSPKNPAEFEEIVICYCRFSPVNTPLEPLPKIQFSEELQEV